jgi:hypothetical protein
LRLELDPATHFVAVSGSIAYHSPIHRLEGARFYLHHQFLIQRLWGKRVMGYQYEKLGTPAGPPFEPGSLIEATPDVVPFLPQAGVLDVYFDPPLKMGETALIQFEYLGNITEWPPEGPNLITPEWAELSMDLPWFPVQYSGLPSDLTFTLQVKAPAGYQVSSYGPATFQDGAWLFTWTQPTSDIVVAAGQTLDARVFESLPNRVFLSTVGFRESAASRLGEEVISTLERFSGWFGPTRPSDFTVIASPRKLGGSYARRGLVVLGGVSEWDYLDQPEACLRYLAREASRAWWWQAPTGIWEDWLNESFAEYSALLAVRERYGVDVFERMIAQKRERAPQAQPLWGFDRADLSTPEKLATVERLLYDKGPLLLHLLEQRIGYQRFMDFCRALLWSGVTTTRHFLDLLEEVEDRETRLWMEEQLRS